MTPCPRTAGFVLVLAFVAAPVATEGAGAKSLADLGRTDGARLALQEAGFDVRDAAGHRAPADLDPGRTLFLVRTPAAEFGPADRSNLAAFVEHGGTILLCDDGSRGNHGIAFAGGYGVGFRSRRISDLDPGQNWSNVRADAAFGQRTFSVRLDRPVALADIAEDDARFRAILTTPSSTYMDLNANEEFDVVDKQGPFLVGLFATVGTQGGGLLVISDARWLVDGNLEAEQNKAFLVALAEDRLGSTGPRTVVFDMSEPEEGGRHWLLPSPAALATLVVGAGAGLALRRRPD